MSDSESDVNVEVEGCNSKKRRNIKQPENYKGNIIKVARLKGDAYVNHGGKSIPAKTPACSCR